MDQNEKSREKAMLDSVSLAKTDGKGDGGTQDIEARFQYPASVEPGNVSSGNVEQSYVNLSSPPNFPRQAKDGSVVCGEPEVEECMEKHSRVQDSLSRDRSLPSKKSLSALVVTPIKMVASSQDQNFCRNRAISLDSNCKDIMVHVTEQPPVDKAPLRVLESIKEVNTLEESQGSSIKQVPHPVKGKLPQVPRVRVEPQVPRERDEIQAPRVKDDLQFLREMKENVGRLPSPSTDVAGHLQQKEKESIAIKELKSPGVANAWVRVEANSSLLSKRLSDSCVNKSSTDSNLWTPPTPPPVDGWICVEHPPMTWEDALKVAQQARETAIGASNPPTARLSPSLPDNLSLLDQCGDPISSQKIEKAKTAPQMPSVPRSLSAPLPLPPPKQSQVVPGVLCAPLPLPAPKQSPSRRKISGGTIKDRINAFESNLPQGPNQFKPKLESENSELKAIPAGVQAEIKEKKQVKGLRNWEDRVKSWEKSAEDNVVPEDWRNTRPSSLRVDKNSLETQCEFTMQKPDGSESNRTDIPDNKTADLQVVKTSTLPKGSKDPIPLRRLPLLEAIPGERIQSELTENSLMPQEVLLEAECRPSTRPTGGSGSLQIQEDGGLISHVSDREAMEEAANLEEEKIVVEVPVPSLCQTFATTGPKLLDNQVTSILHTTSQDSRKYTPGPDSERGAALAPIAVPKETVSQDSLPALKHVQNSAAETRNLFTGRGLLSKEFQPTYEFNDRDIPTGTDDPCTGAAQKKVQGRQVDWRSWQPEKMLKKQSAILPGPLKPPATCATPGQQQPKDSKQDNSGSHEHSRLYHLGGVVKQVLGGAVILAGLFALWPRSIERHHIVKVGETLNSVAPGQCNDPSSKFCRINPTVCDQKFIYPGQRIRLS